MNTDTQIQGVGISFVNPFVNKCKKNIKCFALLLFSANFVKVNQKQKLLW